MADYTIRTVSADDLDEILRIREQSFGVEAGQGGEDWTRLATADLEAGRLLGAYDPDGAGPVAAAKIWDFAQWWGGAVVPMAGISGVVVRPDHRGRGVARTLMTAVVERSRELGAAVSALYPATIPLYRRVGYEIGGVRSRFAFRTEALRGLGRDPEAQAVEVRRGGVDDVAAIRRTMATVHRGTGACGPVRWPQDKAAEWVGRPGTFVYLADDGYAVYRWQDSDLIVDQLVAGSAATARALWAVVGSGSSISTTVYARLAPDDPVHLLAPLEADHEVYTEHWMFRVLDAPAAVAARGYDPELSTEIEFELVDDIVGGNAGRWRLGIEEGTGRLERLDESEIPAGRSLPRLTIGGFSALYAGTHPATLRTAGLLQDSDRHDTNSAGMSRIFAGRPAWQPDFF